MTVTWLVWKKSVSPWCPVMKLSSKPALKSQLDAYLHDKDCLYLFCSLFMCFFLRNLFVCWDVVSPRICCALVCSKYYGTTLWTGKAQIPTDLFGYLRRWEIICHRADCLAWCARGTLVGKILLQRCTIEKAGHLFRDVTRFQVSGDDSYVCGITCQLGPLPPFGNLCMINFVLMLCPFAPKWCELYTASAKWGFFQTWGIFKQWETSLILRESAWTSPTKTRWHKKSSCVVTVSLALCSSSSSGLAPGKHWFEKSGWSGEADLACVGRKHLLASASRSCGLLENRRKYRSFAPQAASAKWPNRKKDVLVFKARFRHLIWWYSWSTETIQVQTNIFVNHSFTWQWSSFQYCELCCTNAVKI